MRRSVRRLAGAIFVLALEASLAGALTVPELLCQQSIGKESLRFVKRVEKAGRRCADAQAQGALCDEVRRNAEIADAQAKLEQKLAAACGAITLESLGFPGACDDPDGSPFTVPALGTCIEASHQSRVDAVMSTSYPGAPNPLAGDDARCQAAIGSAGRHLVVKRLRARQSCRNDQLSGRLGSGVDCRAEPAPGGAGTGDSKTDRRLATALSRADALLARGCAGVTLEDLGFVGMCVDADGAPFTLVDLQSCVRGYLLDADAMLAVEYPS